MANECFKISADILKNCQDIIPGIKDTCYFINIDDIDKASSAFDADNPLLLTSLVLNSTSPVPEAFKLEGHNYSNTHSAEMVKKTYYNTWNHIFGFKVFDNTPEVKEWISNISKSRFVVIQENNYNKNIVSPEGQTVFEVLGWEYGLEINSAKRDANNNEFAGWDLSAQCKADMEEPNPPLAYFVGNSLVSTRSAIASLL
jgi:hypothetical protein